METGHTTQKAARKSALEEILRKTVSQTVIAVLRGLNVSIARPVHSSKGRGRWGEMTSSCLKDSGHSQHQLCNTESPVPRTSLLVCKHRPQWKTQRNAVKLLAKSIPHINTHTCPTLYQTHNSTQNSQCHQSECFKSKCNR